jgi:chromosome segregation ATPase
MVRHLTIGATCLGVAMLLGAGVVIGQLWTWSSSAEQRIGSAGDELNSANEQLREARHQVKSAGTRYTSLESTFTESEREREELAKTASGLRRDLLKLEAQNAELQKAADRAVTLSDEVVDLHQQLAQATSDSGSDQDSLESDVLVLVEKREATAAEDEPRYDNSGWKSISTSSP